MGVSYCLLVKVSLLLLFFVRMSLQQNGGATDLPSARVGCVLLV